MTVEIPIHPDFVNKKVDFENEKVDIEPQKVDIQGSRWQMKTCNAIRANYKFARYKRQE